MPAPCRGAGGVPAACRGLGSWALALALIACVPAPGGAAPPVLPRLGPARNFALTTQQNDRLWLTQLRDRVVLLTFACTSCETCPGLLPALLALERALGDAPGRHVFFVVVSVDPRRDTAAVLRQFARDRKLDLNAWVLLTGKPAEVDVVAHWYGVEVRRAGGRVIHRCLVTLIDGAGVIRGRYAAEELGQLRADIDALLGEAGGS